MVSSSNQIVEIASSDPMTTAAITLFGGVLLFVIQNIIIEGLIKPIRKQKEIIGKIAVLLIHYANLYANPTRYGSMPSDDPVRKKYMSAANKTREYAALLKVKSDDIPLYNFWVKIGYILPKEAIERASRGLVGLSNSFGQEGSGIQNSDIAKEIRSDLKIPSGM